MAVVCVLVLVDVLVLAVWEVVDPLVIVVSNKTLEFRVSISLISTLILNLAVVLVFIDGSSALFNCTGATS